MILISDFIKELEDIKDKYGDLIVTKDLDPNIVPELHVSLAEPDDYDQNNYLEIW